MLGSDPNELLKLAYESLTRSYLLSKWQRKIGFLRHSGPLIHVRYEYMREGQAHRTDNFFAYQAPPDDVIAAVNACHPSADHQLFVIADQPGLVMAYMASGCSAHTPGHYLMAHPLTDIPTGLAREETRRATSAEEAQSLNEIEGADLVLAEDIVDPDLDYYYCLEEGRPAALARNARMRPGYSWVSHVYTEPRRRGRGLATALMLHIMANCRQDGDHFSLLLATEQAHGLYQRLGYQDLAPVINFTLSDP